MSHATADRNAANPYARAIRNTKWLHAALARPYRSLGSLQAETAMLRSAEYQLSRMEQGDQEYRVRYCRATGISMADLRSIIEQQKKRLPFAKGAGTSEAKSLHEARASAISEDLYSLERGKRIANLKPTMRTRVGLRSVR